MMSDVWLVRTNTNLTHKHAQRIPYLPYPACSSDTIILNSHVKVVWWAEEDLDLDWSDSWSVCSASLSIWFLYQGKDCSGGDQPNLAEGSHVYGFGTTCRPSPGVWDSCNGQPESRWDTWPIDSASMKI